MSGEVEQDKCDFCHQIKIVERTYLRPSKYVKPSTLEERNKLYNQGGYFVIMRTCSDCGVPETDSQKLVAFNLVNISEEDKQKLIEQMKNMPMEFVSKESEKANLGCATTCDLIYELAARCDTGSIDKGGNYRTVDNN